MEQISPLRSDHWNDVKDEVVGTLCSALVAAGPAYTVANAKELLSSPEALQAFIEDNKIAAPCVFAILQDWHERWTDPAKASDFEIYTRGARAFFGA